MHIVDVKTGELVQRLPDIYGMAAGSHNWTWHVAGHGRVITSGVLHLAQGENGIAPLPGRLALDVASGYSSPIAPALVDGRLFLRLSDKLVCYDLRKPQDQTSPDVLVIRGEDAVQGLNPETNNDMVLHLRKQGDQLMDISAQWPLLLRNADRVAAPSWLWSDGRVQFRPTAAPNLSWEGDTLSGEALVRVAHHYETWELKLTRDGESWSGDYVRRALPLAEPIAINRPIHGSVQANENGTTTWAMSASGIIAQADRLRVGIAEQTELPNVSLVLTADKSGRIQQAWAGAGKVNGAPWEVDPGSLQIVDGRVQGELHIIALDDAYYDLHSDLSKAEQRNMSTSSPLVGRYAIDVAVGEEGKISGTITGTVGVAWEHTGKATAVVK